MRQRMSALFSLCLVSVVAGPLTAQQSVGAAGGRGSVTDTCDQGVAGFTVRAGWWIDGIQLLCRVGSAVQPMPHRGGTGGGAVTFMLQPGEEIRAISGTYIGPAGRYLYAIQFHTDRRSSPLYGQAGPDRGRQPFRLTLAPGQSLRGIVTTSDQFLSGLQLVAGGRASGGKAPVTDAGAPPPPTPSGGGRLRGAVAGNAALTVQSPPWNQGSGGYCPQANGICTDAQSGLRWQAVPRGGAIPSQAVRMPQQVCRAYVGAPGAQPEPLNGAVESRLGNRCAIVVNGATVTADEFEVLMALPGNQIGEYGERDIARMREIRTPVTGMPDGAIQAAVFGGAPQGICIVYFEGDPGREIVGRYSSADGACLIGGGPTAVVRTTRYTLIGHLRR